MGSRDAGSASIHTVTSKIWCGMHRTHLLNMALGEGCGAPGTLAIMGQIMYALTANQKTRSACRHHTIFPRHLAAEGRTGGKKAAAEEAPASVWLHVAMK
jgi:hypothetical protein